MKHWLKLLLIIFTAQLLGACTHIQEIRTKHVDNPDAIIADPDTNLLAQSCESGRETANATRASIEHFSGGSTIGYVEFDDQGWLYPTTEPVNQIDAILNVMRKDYAKDYAKNSQSRLIALVFVHGWHHNAWDNDCNVNEFRVMVTRLAKALRLDHPDAPFHVYGIYVGWRGESVDAPLLRYLTFIDRRDAADHVAKGSVRQLFAQLRDFSDELPDIGDHHAMDTIVVGHSFGGLIAFQSLSQALTNDIIALKPRYDVVSNGCKPPPPKHHSIWPNQLILINPAFEASRYEALFYAASIQKGQQVKCPYVELPHSPRVLTVAATNDIWTHQVFHTVRWLGTRFEGYNKLSSAKHKEDEEVANHNSIGFTDRYATHLLHASANSPQVAIRVPDFNTGSTDVEVGDENLPLWVAQADRQIVDHHDQFLFDPRTKRFTLLMDWLICLDYGPIEESAVEQCQLKLKQDFPIN